ncbi:MAG: sugar-binding transcriptional regulator [Sarcina sp.]
MFYEEDLIYKIAWFYYFDNMTQQEISKILNISRTKIVRYLEQARNQNIIQFKIKKEGESRLILENSLMKKYNLSNAFVVPTSSNINESLGKATAQFIEANTDKNCFINIGYGDTVSKVIANLDFSAKNSLSLVALTGGMSFYTSSLALSSNNPETQKLARIFLIPSPLIVSSESLANELLKEQSLIDIFKMTALASYTIVGIGSVDEKATVFKHNMLNPNELVLLRMQNAVGDILSQFFDEDGNKIETPLHNRLISVNLSDLKSRNNIIGVAGGLLKRRAIKAALKGGYLDILITDEDTAKYLIE